MSYFTFKNKKYASVPLGAKNIPFNNVKSNLSASNVQDAIDAITGNIVKVDNNMNTQAEIFSILTSNMTSNETNVYNCNWQDYELICITMGNYWNAEVSIVVPTAAYFSTTGEGTRVILIRPTNADIRCSVFQNGENIIKLSPSANCVSANNFYIRIYGVISK